MKITFPTRPTVTSGGVTIPMRVNLCYRPGFDPFAVEMVLFPAATPIRWLFARDLLRDGLSRPVGEAPGRIRITPGEMTVGVHWSGPWGDVLVTFARDDVAAFVQSMFLQVPDGRESAHLDWSDLPEVLA